MEGVMAENELIEAASVLRRMAKQLETSVIKLKQEGALLVNAEKVIDILEKADKTRLGIESEIAKLNDRLEASKKSVAEQSEKAAKEIAEINAKLAKATADSTEIFTKRNIEQKKAAEEIANAKASVETAKSALNKQLADVEKQLAEKTALLNDIKKKLSAVVDL